MIKVLHPGIFCSVQDRGRFGLAKTGIPTSGSMDATSAELGNSLLQNEKNCAVIEITFGQGKFQFEAPAYICLSGGDFSPKLNGEPIVMNKVYAVEKGTILSFGKRNYGARTYLAVQGGIDSEVVLGSRSFSSGITKTRLEKGEELKISAKKDFFQSRNARVKSQEYFSSSVIDCFPGPEFEKLNQEQKLRLLKPFSISEDNNRVGYRLNETIVNKLESILTSAVLPGTVQLTPSGKLIVLMRDCQVTGGYPRVLQLSESAISILGQKIKSDQIQFSLIC